MSETPGPLSFPWRWKENFREGLGMFLQYQDEDEFALKSLGVLSKEKMIASLHQLRKDLYCNVRDLIEREKSDKGSMFSFMQSSRPSGPLTALMDMFDDIDSQLQNLQAEQNAEYRQLGTRWERLKKLNRRKLMPHWLQKRRELVEADCELKKRPMVEPADSSNLKSQPSGNTKSRFSEFIRSSFRRQSANSDVVKIRASNDSTVTPIAGSTRVHHRELDSPTLTSTPSGSCRSTPTPWVGQNAEDKVVQACMKYYDWPAAMAGVWSQIVRLVDVFADDESQACDGGATHQKPPAKDVEARVLRMKVLSDESQMRLESYTTLCNPAAFVAPPTVDQLLDSISGALWSILSREHQLLGALEEVGLDREKLVQENQHLLAEHVRLVRVHKQQEAENGNLCDILRSIESETRAYAEKARAAMEEKEALARQMGALNQEHSVLAEEAAYWRNKTDDAERHPHDKSKEEELKKARDQGLRLISERDKLLQRVVEIHQKSLKLVEERDSLHEQNLRLIDQATQLEEERNTLLARSSESSQATQERIRQLVAEKQQLLDMQEQLENEKSELFRRISDLQSNNNSFRSEEQWWDAGATQGKVRVEKTEFFARMYSRLMATQESLEHDTADLHRRIADLESQEHQHVQTRQAIADRENDSNAADGAARDLQLERSHWNRLRQAYEDEKAALLLRVETARRDYDVLRREIDQLQQDNADLNRKTDTAMTQRKKALDELSLAKRDLDARTAQVEALRIANKLLGDRLETTEPASSPPHGPKLPRLSLPDSLAVHAGTATLPTVRISSDKGKLAESSEGDVDESSVFFSGSSTASTPAQSGSAHPTDPFKDRSLSPPPASPSAVLRQHHPPRSEPLVVVKGNANGTLDRTSPVQHQKQPTYVLNKPAVPQLAGQQPNYLGSVSRKLFG